MNWVTFFYDCNACCGLINSEEEWNRLVENVMVGHKANRIDTISFILDGRHAPQQEINRVDSEGGNYFMGALGVVSGTTPSFGYRREHTGAFTLRGWATSHNCLSKLV